MKTNALEVVKPKQLKILSELEEIVGKTIPSVKKINIYTIGVKIEGKKIIGLGLNSCGLSILPEPIIRLKSLQKLYLFRNQIRGLPEEIDKLKKLKELNLGRNQLESLPESIGNLASLTTIFLNYNQLSNLPESMANLMSIKLLDLENNNLTTLPESINHLKESGAIILN